MYDAVFYVAYPYYFPHFLPISQELKRRGKKCLYLLSDKQNSVLMEKIAKEEELAYEFGEEKIFEVETKVVFFANPFSEAGQLKAKTVFLCHGTGTKKCGFKTAFSVNDFVLVEGDYRFKKFRAKFPEKKEKMHKVGYSKLDAAVNFSEDEKRAFFEQLGLDTKKKTILYAPTYYPSSIEKMSNTFPKDFANYNIVVKPHYLSLERKRYKKQQQKFAKWAKFSNCVVADASHYNLVPFMAIADVMISDESAAIFEFTALNKPVVINRFLKLRLSYLLNPKKLLSRMDSGMDQYRSIGKNAASYKEMLRCVNEELEDHSEYEAVRLEYAKEICGEVDGRVSQRIADLVEKIDAQ